LSLAFAKPMINLPALGGPSVQRVILIDDSTSMLSLDGNPDRITLAKEMAISLIQETSRRDQSMIITFGGDAEFLGSTSHLSKEELIQAVEKLDVQGTGIDLRTGLALAQSNTSFDLPLEIYVLTDAAFEPQDVQDFPVDIHWVFIGFERNNQAVIDPVLETHSTKTELFFRLVNYSSNQVERELEILVNQQVVNQQQVLLSPLSVQPQVISISGDVEMVEIHLKGQDSLPIDDVAVLSNIIDPPVKVALVTEFPDPLDRAIAAVPGAELSIYSPLEYSTNFNFNLVIFRGVFPESWPSGKVIVFDPPMGNSKVNVMGLEKITAPIEVTPHEVLDGVDLSGVRWEFTWTVSEDISGERLVKAGEFPLMVSQRLNGTDVFFFFPQLSSGNFIKHPAFPILLASLVSYSREYSPEPNYQVGEAIDFSDVLETTQISLQAPKTEEPGLVVESSTVLDEVGFYSLKMTDRYGETGYQFGVNAGEFQESNINPREWRLQVATLVVILLVLEAWRAWH
jgi:hypothetical protein